MAVDAQAVQIQIDVVDNNSAAAIGGVTKNIESMGSAANAAGRQTAQGMSAAGAAAREATGHFQTNLDSVRLLRQELGVHVPRSMETLISRNQMLMAGISKLSGLMAGVGFGMIGVGLGEEAVRVVHELWGNYLSLNSAAAQYRDEVEKTKQEDFGNSNSIETTTLRIKQATDAAKDFRAEAERTNRAGWNTIVSSIASGNTFALAAGIGALNVAHQEAGFSVQKQQQVDKLTPESAAQQHELNLATIEYNHALDDTLSKHQKIAAQERERVQRASENRRYEAEANKALGNPVDPNAGAAKEKLADSTAQQRAWAENYALQKQEAQEMMSLRHAAVESSLRGEALYHQQELDAIEDLKNKDIDRATATGYIQDKFHGEQMKRLEDERREVEALERASAAAGLTGIARTRREGEDKIGGIHDSDFADVDVSGHSALAERKRVAIARETDGQITEERRQAAAEIDRVADQSASHQVSGFGRIRSEASKEIDELRTKIEAVYGKAPTIGPPSPDQLAGANLISKGTGMISADAARQTGDLARRNEEETSQIEADARAKLLSSEKQQTAAIEIEWKQRTDKYFAELKAREIGWDDYNRRVVAAGQERDAQLNEAAKAAREKMAGEFSHFFEHPMDSLKEMGEKAAGEAAAAAVQRVQGHFGGTAAAASAPSPGGIWDKIMGRVAGVPHGAASGSPHGHESSTASAMHIATAQISIGSASFAGFGGGAVGSGSSFAPGGFATAPGFTRNSVMPGAMATSGGFSGSGSTFAPGASVPGAAGGSTGLLAVGGGFSSGGGTGASGGGWSAGGGGSYVGGGGASARGSGAWGDSGANGSAGIPASARAATNFNAGSGAPPPPGQNKVMGALGGVQQVLGLAKQGASIFGGGGGAAGSNSQDQYAETQDPTLNGKLNSDGTFTSSGSTNGGMLGGGGIGANMGGAVSGALGMYAAYEGNGGFGGAASGAMSGMELGMALGGPIGAAVGAAAGAIVGAIGFGGREKARVYDLKQVRPRLASDMDSYQQGSMDYLAAYSDIEALSREANLTTNKMGSAAKSYYQDTIKNEIKQAEGRLSSEERAGRSQYTTTAAQYDVGGIMGHGEMGVNLSGADERVLSPSQTQNFDRMTRALETSADSRSMPAQPGWGGDAHLHIHALDTKTARQAFMNHKHELRAAINASYGENSGGGDA